MRCAIAFLILSLGSARAADIVDLFPSSTNFLIGINFKPLNDAPLVKQNTERLKSIFSDWTAALVNLGIEPSAIEQIWIAAGEGYPNGTAILIYGKIDPVKVANKMQEHIRKPRFAVRPFREGTVSCYSLETPVGMNIIPGLSSTLCVTARNDSVIITFDQGTLQTLLKPIEPAKSARDRFANQKELFEKTSELVAAFHPTESLTGNGSLLTGVSAVEVVGEVEFSLLMKLIFRCGDPAGFQPRLRNGLEQAKQLFGPLAAQQGVDPKLTQFLQELLNSAKLDAKDKDVVLTAEMSADLIGRIMKK